MKPETGQTLRAQTSVPGLRICILGLGEHFFQPKRNRNSFSLLQLFLLSGSLDPSHLARSRGGAHAFGKQALVPAAASGYRAARPGWGSYKQMSPRPHD